jgi:predicted ATPase
MTAANPPGLPGPLRLTPSFPFVGRARELATLRALMPDAESDGGRVALIAGESGSGKSRLVRELAQEVASDGVLVLYGACDAVVRTPYEPFVTALEQLVRDSDPDVLRAELGTAGGELTRLFPDQLDLDSDGVKALEEINADEGVRWLFSFLSADRRQSYCLYEAPSPDELIAAARRAGIPADIIVEVNRVSPEMVA